MSRKYNKILLVEDDSHTSGRRFRAGVSRNRYPSITIRVHRFNGTGSQVVAKKTYRAGSLRNERNGRIKIAAQLLESSWPPTDDGIVVAGTSYGTAGAFLSTLTTQGVPFVVQIRPSTKIDILGEIGQRTAGQILQTGIWRNLRTPLPDGTPIEYAAAKLPRVVIPNGKGRLFAARVGGVEGAQRTTIIGLSSFDGSLRELVRLLGYSRWFRQSARRRERHAKGKIERTEPQGTAASLRVRANITLAKKQDVAVGQKGVPEHFMPTGELRSISSTLNVVELFAGAGGMGLGFLLAGKETGDYRLLYSGEVHPIFAQTLRRNHQTISSITGRPASEITPECTTPVDLRHSKVLKEVAERSRSAGGTNILIGGPPCQGFSMANRNSWHGQNPNNQLVEVFLRYVKRLQPQVFLMENVQGILWTPKGRSSVSVVDALEQRMRSLGYLVFPKLLDAVWFGVPQHRTRFFLLGLHRDLGYGEDAFGEWGPFPSPTHGGANRPYVTVANAISDLPQVGNGDNRNRIDYREPTTRLREKNPFLQYVREGAERGTILDHITSRHADYVIDRYRKIPPGGNWENIKDDLTNYSNVSRTHSNIYRRLCWSDPSITIGHYRKSMLIHPAQHRGLSLREAARLQSFPDWFQFSGTIDGSPGGLMHKQQQLANAVCPLVTKAIAELLIQL